MDEKEISIGIVFNCSFPARYVTYLPKLITKYLIYIPHHENRLKRLQKKLKRKKLILSRQSAILDFGLISIVLSTRVKNCMVFCGRYDQKGDDCNNYHGISLLSILNKISSNIILSRLSP
jgi:hypothetical protein